MKEKLFKRLGESRKSVGSKDSEVKHRYSDARKIQILNSHFSDHVSITLLSKKYGISRQTIYAWIHNFASGKLVPVKRAAPKKSNPKVLPMSKKKGSLSEAEVEELHRLREENKRLSEALKMAEWSNHAKDVMIDIAEETFNIPIRKKSGAKQ